MRLAVVLALALAAFVAPDTARASLLDLTLTPPALASATGSAVRLIDDGSPVLDAGSGGELAGWDAFWAITLGVTGCTVSVVSVGVFGFGALLAAGGNAGGLVLAALGGIALFLGMNVMALTTLFFLEPPPQRVIARAPPRDEAAAEGVVVLRFDPLGS